MKALCWEGKHSIQVKNVRDPRILNPQDAIIKVTSAAICGSDLHLYNGYIPAMEKGDIMGHETMGEVVEIGPMVKKINVGDKIVIPFDIGCGKCHHCKDEEYSACDNSNPNAIVADKLYSQAGSAAFGFSQIYGGYAGGQAEYIRVPYADTNSLVIPAGIPDEKVLFLSDIFPTGYMAGGRGPDSCIDAVGMEAHGYTVTASVDRVKATVGLATDRPDALRQAIQACKKGGTVSVPGVYGGFLDKFPFGAAFGKGLTFKMGQAHTQKYMKPL